MGAALMLCCGVHNVGVDLVLYDQRWRIGEAMFSEFKLEVSVMLRLIDEDDLIRAEEAELGRQVQPQPENT